MFIRFKRYGKYVMIVVLKSRAPGGAPRICGESVWNLLRVTSLVPEILRWILDIWKNLCNPASYIGAVNLFHLVVIYNVVFSPEHY